MKHISIRVPWHDNSWNGRYCLNPSCNTFCKVLPNIAKKKKDSEDELAGMEWGTLPKDKRPACAEENGGFMNSYGYNRVFIHRYSHLNQPIPHKDLLPTKIEVSPYTVFGIPYRYMSKDEQTSLKKAHPEFSPDEAAPFPTSWLYGRERQNDVLNWFRSNIGSNESLCIFYCKGGNPIEDQGKRLIVGIGDITKVHPVLHYDSRSEITYPFWEIMMEHSIRKNLKESNGFLIPYHEYLNLEEEYVRSVCGLSKEEALNEIKLSSDTFDNDYQLTTELSYGCNYVRNQSMLKVLSAARASILAVIRHGLVGGDWQKQLRWINGSIAKVKLMISPFPSFAEVLKAIGVNYAYLVEEDIKKNGCGPKDNPWEYYEKLMAGTLPLVGEEYKSELPYYRDEWKARKRKNDIEFLKLLSRFELPDYVIEELIADESCHTQIIANPYTIAERYLADRGFCVTTQTIDLGVIKDPDIQGVHIPTSPSLVETLIDKRRIRALIVEKLAIALEYGDTLLSISEIVEGVSDCLTKDDMELPTNFISSQKDFFSEVMAYVRHNDTDCGLQLKDYKKMEDKLSRQFSELANRAVKNPLTEDWYLKAKQSDYYKEDNSKSVEAAIQQVKALEMMSSQRFSVLTGGAGTGKTAVVETFLSSEQILREGVLLLAPTGKARVRLEKMSKGRNIKAQTVAQFLLRRGRLDENMNPVINAKGKKFGTVRNIIIDECSMLTLNDMYVLFDSIDFGEVYRVILIGDQSQLPPIGPGRPFSDLCNFLHNPDNNRMKAITKLEVTVRTSAGGNSDILTLASWFSGDKPKKEALDIFQRIESNSLDEKSDLRIYTWENEDDIIDTLKKVLCEEYHVSESELCDTLRRQIGIDNVAELRKRPDKLENLQIITPVLNPVWGSYQLNDKVQEWIGTVTKDKSGIHIGVQTLYPRDKVILCKNEKEHMAYPSGEKYQLSNGQIGFVSSNVGKNCNVTLSSIPGETFGYRQDSSEDGERVLELAYAITIHKSQGSDFNTTVIVLPKGGQFISREMIYTALTRARDKAILLVQDNVGWLREKSKPQYSELGRRNTNMFGFSVREHKKSIPYVEGLIHRSKHKVNDDYLYVRSKSEVIIVNELVSQGIEFEYERQIDCEGGKKFIPDFTFTNMFGDRIIWEHLGMLGVEEYKTSWEKKLKAYEDAGFIENEKLFITEDKPDGSIDTVEVLDVIDRIKAIIE